MASLFSWLVQVFVCLFLLLVGWLGGLCVLVTKKKIVIMPGTVSLARPRQSDLCEIQANLHDEFQTNQSYTAKSCLTQTKISPKSDNDFFDFCNKCGEDELTQTEGGERQKLG